MGRTTVGLFLRSLWIAVFLSPRKAHTIFLSATHDYAGSTMKKVLINV